MSHRTSWMGPLGVLAVGLLAACESDAPTMPETSALEARVAGSEHGGRPFRVSMTGPVEVPVAGDPDGSGTALLTMNPGQGEVCWEITVSAIMLPATAAHIHEAPAGQPGGVVVPLSAPDESGAASGCTDADPELIEEIFDDPAGYYVNVHNVEFPGGAVRGQLR